MRLECITVGSYKEPEPFPSYVGIPEYFVTDITTEALPGGICRVVCGVRHHGEVQWLYSCVMPAALVATISQQVAECGRQASSGVTRRVSRLSDIDS